ncbi:MAG TPA: hypothetical protein VGN44_04065 [Candidatus Angelobacter sp.]|jgi:hypothetical protein
MQSWPQIIIDWMGLPSLAVLACVLLYRRWYKEFPLFFSYVIIAELIGLARFFFMGATGKIYTYVYWISDTALAVFAFLATYELFVKRLFPAFYRTRVYRYLFPLTAIMVTGMAVVLALLGTHSSIFSKTIRMYGFLRAIILLFFVALMVIMGRLWSKQEFGIAFGFVLDVSTSLALMGIWSHSPNRSVVLDRLSVFAYDVACIIWIYCFWPKPITAVTAKTISPEALQEAKKWEGSLKDFIAPDKP